MNSVSTYYNVILVRFVQTMRIRTKRNYCFARVLGASKKAVPLIILNVYVCDSTLSCITVCLYDYRCYQVFRQETINENSA